jgi:hypothetical protein
MVGDGVNKQRRGNNEMKKGRIRRKAALVLMSTGDGVGMASLQSLFAYAYPVAVVKSSTNGR